MLWGGWAAVCAAVFSLSKGIFHPYYTVQLAPAVAALAGAGAVALWQVGRQHHWFGWVLPAAVVATAAVAVEILDRTPNYHPWLRTAIMVGAGLAAAGLLAGTYLRHKLTVAVAALVAATTLLAGPGAYALTTISHSTSGSIVSAGPAGTGGGFGGGARPSAAGTGGFPGGRTGATGPTATAGGARPGAPPPPAPPRAARRARRRARAAP